MVYKPKIVWCLLIVLIAVLNIGALAWALAVDRKLDVETDSPADYTVMVLILLANFLIGRGIAKDRFRRGNFSIYLRSVFFAKLCHKKFYSDTFDRRQTQ